MINQTRTKSLSVYFKAWYLWWEQNIISACDRKKYPIQSPLRVLTFSPHKQNTITAFLHQTIYWVVRRHVYILPLHLPLRIIVEYCRSRNWIVEIRSSITISDSRWMLQEPFLDGQGINVMYKNVKRCHSCPWNTVLSRPRPLNSI